MKQWWESFGTSALVKEALQHYKNGVDHATPLRLFFTLIEESEYSPRMVTADITFTVAYSLPSDHVAKYQLQLVASEQPFSDELTVAWSSNSTDAGTKIHFAIMDSFGSLLSTKLENYFLGAQAAQQYCINCEEKISGTETGLCADCEVDRQSIAQAFA